MQRRREWPTKVIQAVQRFLQSQIVAGALDRGKPFRLPLVMRVVTQTPLLNQLPARLLGYGVRPELPRSADGGR